MYGKVIMLKDTEMNPSDEMRLYRNNIINDMICPFLKRKMKMPLWQ